MSSGFKPEDDEYGSGRARRGKAGSLRPAYRGGTSSSKTSTPPPQAIVKVAGWAPTPASVKRMLDYVARVEDKEERELVALETEDGVLRKGRDEVDEIIEEWKPDFERKSKGRSNQTRHAVHLVLSAKAELSARNVARTVAAARRVLEKHVGEAGYPYALGVHQDGKNPHVHAVIKTVSREKDVPKLRLTPARLLEMRKSLAEELTREGLEHVASRMPRREKTRRANMKGEAPNTLQKVEAVLKKLRKEQRQFERALGRKEPKVNTIQFRQQQGKALDTLRAQAKDDTALTGKDRQEAFNLIRGFRREIEKKGVNPEFEMKATVNHFQSRIADWKKELGKDMAIAHTVGRKPSLKALKKGEALQRDIHQFIGSDLRQQDIPVETKKAIYAQLRKEFLEIKKTNERWMGRER
ncbi:relaxase/mobilization nuclease domain-containing protein [Pseudodesulfovibrio indicus]|nr:relaxase/mobilization nuclease domain-containing protein [Pseudodesulfovibrio indicus]